MYFRKKIKKNFKFLAENNFSNFAQNYHVMETHYHLMETHTHLMETHYHLWKPFFRENFIPQ
jgi:hypothetical protein